MKGTLEELLRMTVKVKTVNKLDLDMIPQFRVSVQEVTKKGVHFIIHADGYDSETLDFICKDNKLKRKF